MIAQTTLLAAFAVLALAGQAVAQDGQPPIDTISASQPGPGEDTDVRWILGSDDLARLYPAVARAIASPDFLVEVGDDEQESTHAFFEEMARRGANVLEVDGKVHSVGISIASGGMPPASAEDVPPDATSHSGAPSEAAASGGLTGAGVLAGVALLVGLAGLGGAALALRRK